MSADLIDPCIKIHYPALETLISPGDQTGKMNNRCQHTWLSPSMNTKFGEMTERWESTITWSFIYSVILFTLTKKLTRWSWFPSRLWSTHGQALTLLYLHRKCFSVLQLLVLSSCVHLWVRSLPRNSFSEGLKEQRFRKGNSDKYQPGRPKKRKRKNERYFLT